MTEHSTEVTKALKAMERASEIARERAKLHGIPLVVCKNGRVAWVDPVTEEEVGPPDRRPVQATGAE